MKNKKSSNIHWKIILISGLLLIHIIFYLAYYHLVRENDRVLTELNALRKQEKQSDLIQSVSRQMEEIAYQQKDISEERRREAVAQTEKASRMQHQANVERERALAAQSEAEKAYRQADWQKELAMKRLLQAEYSRRVADTLSYLSLGRSLGTFSVIQYQSGNTELAALLAYSSWNFTQKSGGDAFHPAIFNALSRSCQQGHSWFHHKGAITSIIPVEPIDSIHQNERLVTCSKYGELLRWDYDGKYYSVTTLVKDTRYDFRCVYQSPNGFIYSLSYNGSLVIAGPSGIQVIPLSGSGFKWMVPLEGNRLCIISTQGIYIFDCLGHTVHSVDTLGATITFAGKSEKCIYVFMEEGRTKIYSLKGEFIRYAKDQTDGLSVTAFCSLSGTGYAVGCKDGCILLCQPDGTVIKKLIGHRAPVTSLSIQGSRLFSGSYDNTLRMWNMEEVKVEPAVILEHTGWIHSFYLSSDEAFVFMGDEQGGLYQFPFSPAYMADVILGRLVRNFTREEWEYYIGVRIPFESYYSPKLPV